MTNWYQSQYEAAMEESVRKAEATLQQFRCMAMANQDDHQRQLDALSIEELGQETDSSPQSNHPSSEIEEDEQELQTQIDSSKVISVYPSFAKINVELVKTTELGKHCIESVKSLGESVEDWTDIRTDFRKRSVEFLEFSSAHKLFVKMTRHGESSIAIAEDIVKYKGVLILVFDPGGVFALALVEEKKSEITIDDWSHYREGVFGHRFGSTRQDSILLPYDKRKVVSLPCCWDEEINCGVTIFKLCDVLILVFDPGISEWVIFYQFSDPSVWVDGCLWCCPCEQWGYCSGSFGVEEHHYNGAIGFLSSMYLDEIIAGFRPKKTIHDINRIVRCYRDMSETQLTNLQELLRYMLTIKSRVPPRIKIAMGKTAVPSAALVSMKAYSTRGCPRVRLCPKEKEKPERMPVQTCPYGFPGDRICWFGCKGDSGQQTICEGMATEG